MRVHVCVFQHLCPSFPSQLASPTVTLLKDIAKTKIPASPLYQTKALTKSLLMFSLRKRQMTNVCLSLCVFMSFCLLFINLMTWQGTQQCSWVGIWDKNCGHDVVASFTDLRIMPLPVYPVVYVSTSLFFGGTFGIIVVVKLSQLSLLRLLAAQFPLLIITRRLNQ